MCNRRVGDNIKISVVESSTLWLSESRESSLSEEGEEGASWRGDLRWGAEGRAING